jgi:hypothetical protein
MNIAPGTFDSRRELAIEVDDPAVIERLQKTFHSDWDNSKPMDLSDEGLLAELEGHDENVAEELAIHCSPKELRES